MPKVLILGATGYLGRQIVNLLVQQGQNTVFGVARTPAKATQLSKQEIIPILCPDPVNEPGPYLSAIESKHIDVVIDVAGADHGSHNFLNDVARLGAERLADAKRRGVKGPTGKLGFIYCSGTWVHGSSSGHWQPEVNDLDIVGSAGNTPPEELVEWRVGMENAILALLYGRESTIWSSFIMPVYRAVQDGRDDFSPLEIPLDAHSRPGLIHVDDAAAAFAKAVEKVHLFAGTGVYPVFDLVTSQEAMREIFDALATCWGFRGEVVLKGHGGELFAKAMSTSFRGSSARAQQLLGWKPKRLNGFVQDMDIFAAAFLAEHNDVNN
ncbi:unnamed protein product [Penicillium pancosmium]